MTHDVYQPADPDDDAWPLPASTQPEYPIDCILAERTYLRCALKAADGALRSYYP